MLCFRVQDHLGRQPIAAGVELGRAHAAEAAALLDAAPPLPGGALLGWDFEGVALASISYVKATVLQSVAWGRWHAQALTHLEADWMEGQGGLARDVFPFVLNPNAEVADAVDHALGRQGWPVLAGASAIEDSGGGGAQPLARLALATLLGQIDPAAARTLEAIDGLDQCTALQLHERFARTQGIGATGWNNRLADLHRARLARRSRQGKSWVYYPLAKTVDLSYGKRIH